MNIVAQPRLVTLRDAQRMLGLSRSSLYRLFGRGVLPAKKIGRSIRIDIADIEALIASAPEAKIAPPTR